MQTDTPRVGAVVLAGGRIPESLAQLAPCRALLRVGDGYLLDTLCAALRDAPSVAGIALVAPAEALPALAHLPGRGVPSGATLVENMLTGARALTELKPTHLLFITGDLPLVTVEGIESYVQDSLRSGAALTYPIIPRAVCEQRFPGGRRTYVRLKEGTFTGGNAIFTGAQFLDDKGGLIQDIYAARKQPLKLARILGWGTVLHLLLGTLTLPRIEATASRILGAPARALISPHAEIGFDVDKLADLQAVEAALAQSKPPSGG